MTLSALPPRLPLLVTLAAFLLAPHAASAGVLVSTDFSAPLPSAANAFASAGGAGATLPAVAALTPDGTIDTYKGPRSPALSLTADLTSAPSDAKASAALVTPRFSVTNTETDLAKLTLGFDLWTATARPVRVVLTSFTADGVATGTRTATIVPPVSGAFYRFGLDLDKTRRGEGKFNPRAPQIQFRFELHDADDSSPLPRAAGPLLRVDNLSYTAPSFYVRARGADTADGRSAKTAFATIPKAVDAAAPGDVILIMDGTYASAPKEDLLKIFKKGAPDRWIVLRSHPGHEPVLTGDGWHVVNLDHQAAYIELRALTVRGQRKKFDLKDALADPTSGKYPDSRFNTNGISLDARKGTEEGGKAHHIRFIGNTISDMPGGGLPAIAGDHLTIEGNHIYDNAHLMRYAGSGISVFRSWDFDTDTGYKNFVIANRTHGNRCYVPWTLVGKISDGNGIIIDDTINSQKGASKVPYKGRTLVQNNLSFNNGGSGIHAYASNHVDIVNNTAYHNAQSPELVWSQIFAGGKCIDVRIVNNVFHAQRGKPLDLSVPRSSRDIVYAHNLYFGDGDNNVKAGGGLGTDESAGSADRGGNLYADPKFVRASVDPLVADFRLQPGSPGIDAGGTELPLVPRLDLDGRPRPQGTRPDLGAYELPAAR
ncbi:MAG: right-handed parallel beta-helix repeat-containing protein [Burkholderiales bacterium]|nr:right-handed parallel beta-helix repeat-containing protein [Opitutaceae bacterium]